MGLRYLVRGDLLFGDGSVLTLDETSKAHGLAMLPYAPPMPDELTRDETELLPKTMISATKKKPGP